MPVNLTGRGDTLLDRMAEKCVLLSRAVAPDGLGGSSEPYTDDTEFYAMIRKDSTTADRIAEKQGVKESYTVVVTRGVSWPNRASTLQACSEMASMERSSGVFLSSASPV